MSATTVSAALPQAASNALSLLEEAGFSAWIVGGFVRDALLGQAGNDIDIATDASWQTVQQIFESHGAATYETGTKHGTLTVAFQDVLFEITTFRTDGAYLDGRHPEHVTFVSSIEEDLARRDFTINAIAFNPAHGILDPFDGIGDIARKTIKAIGNPEERFHEDALRILRACRFSSQLGFSIDADTYSAMVRSKSLVLQTSRERITSEIEKLLMGDHVHQAIMGTVDVLTIVLPELTACKGFDQRTPYHIYDVLEHTAYAVEYSPATPLSRWTALFHDIGKPAAFFTDEKGTGHFYGHEQLSAKMARGAFQRFSLAPSFVEKVITLVRIHDHIIAPTHKSVRKALRQFEGDVELFRALCYMKRADAMAQAPRCKDRIVLAENLLATCEEVIADEEAFSRSHLAIDGNDILALGVPEGPEVREALDAALESVIDEQTDNTRYALLEFLKEHIG